MFIINKDKTPIIAAQDNGFQQVAKKFNVLYTAKASVVARVAWGEQLHRMKEWPSLVTVDADGKPVESEDPKATTFAAICRELGIARTTAIGYVNEYITSKTYPDDIREAAFDAGLNLALPHVQAKFAELASAGLPAKPTSLELRGIVAELEEAKPDKKDDEPITRADFVKGLARLIKRGLKSLSAPTIISAVGQVMKDAELPEDQREAMLHTALDVVDKSMGIDTRNVTGSALVDSALSAVPGDVAAAESKKS